MIVWRNLDEGHFAQTINSSSGPRSTEFRKGNGRGGVWADVNLLLVSRTSQPLGPVGHLVRFPVSMLFYLILFYLFTYLILVKKNYFAYNAEFLVCDSWHQQTNASSPFVLRVVVTWTLSE